MSDYALFLFSFPLRVLLFFVGGGRLRSGRWPGMYSGTWGKKDSPSALALHGLLFRGGGAYKLLKLPEGMDGFDVCLCFLLF